MIHGIFKQVLAMNQKENKETSKMNNVAEDTETSTLNIGNLSKIS